MKKTLLALAAAMLLSACGNDKEFTLTGTLANGEGKMVYVEELTPDGPMFIDSIRLDKKGHFEFHYEMPYRSFYNLHVSVRDYVVLLPQEGEKIDLTGDYTQLDRSYEVSGSPESILLWQLQKYSNYGTDRLMEIVAMDQENRATLHGADSLKAHEVTDSLYRDAFKEQYDYLVHFIEENRGSLATIIALYKPFNGDHLIIEPQYNLEWYEEVLAGLEELLPTNPHTNNFALRVASLRYRCQQ